MRVCVYVARKGTEARQRCFGRRAETPPPQLINFMLDGPRWLRVQEETRNKNTLQSDGQESARRQKKKTRLDSRIIL